MFLCEKIYKRSDKTQIMEKLSIIIPVYNEAATCEELLKRVLKVNIPLKKEIIIIESNSTDGTKEIIKRFEKGGKKKDIKIIWQPKPQGKGNAVREGLKAATGDIILIQDADLEYKPEEYSLLLHPILENKTLFVLGSRPLGKECWNIRKYAGYFFYARLLNIGGLIYTMLFNVLYGVWLTDPATMFKVFRKECIKDIQWKTNYFDFDWELVAKLIKRRYRPIEVPISYISRSTQEGKKIRFLRDGFLVFLAIVRFRFVN